MDRYSYDQWGKPISISEAVPQQLRYAGYWYDTELQWYWLSVRSYDTTLERFLQPDPSEIEGVQSYTYAGNDPVDAIDPSGLETCIFNLHSTDANSAKGADCEDDPAGVTEDTTAPENNVAISGLEGATLIHGGVRGEAGIFDLVLRLCEITHTCDFASALKHAILTGAAITVGILTFVYRASGVCQDIDTILHDSNTFHKLAAFGDLALWIPGFDVGKGLELLARVGVDLVRFKAAARIIGCAFCFSAGTMVATPHGAQPIQTLRSGDQVLSEDPQSGKVESEQVEEVIDHPASPLIAVDLSDGSSITVTADHPFWIDRSAHLLGPGWFGAGQLRFGDQLRTVTGTPASVVGLRYNVGTADVYTLTVARNHTFFVGSARVLVHNADATCRTILSNLGHWNNTLKKEAQTVFKNQAAARETVNLLTTFANGGLPGKPIAHLAGTDVSYLRGNTEGGVRIFYVPAQ